MNHRFYVGFLEGFKPFPDRVFKDMKIHQKEDYFIQQVIFTIQYGINQYELVNYNNVLKLF